MHRYSETTALRRQSAPSRAASRERIEPLVVSGLTKAEAEDLLDYFEAAGLGSGLLSYIDGEGYRIRLAGRSRRR